jgi:hypothetical protein
VKQVGGVLPNGWKCDFLVHRTGWDMVGQPFRPKLTENKFNHLSSRYKICQHRRESKNCLSRDCQPIPNFLKSCHDCDVPRCGLEMVWGQVH